MIDRNIILENSKKKFDGKLLDIVLEQIDNYFKLVDLGSEIDNLYKIGDEVRLTKDHLLHGIGNNVEYLPLFAERGIVSQDFLGDDSNHAFCYTAAFWSVDDDIAMREFIKKYSGMVVKYNDSYEQVPYGMLDNFVEKMKDVDHWLWTAESSMEIRFMPSLAKNVNQIGFVVNMKNDMAKELRKNSVFKDEFNKEYAYYFVSDKAKEKFLKEGFTQDFFMRAEYLIFGVPRCLIEGIVVGRDVENDKDSLDTLKKLFGNCYICNLDGIVISM